MRPPASGTANVGHGRAEIADAAAAQMRKLAAYSNFGVYTTAPTLELVERLVAVSPIADAVVFLTSGGSESVDTAGKLARRYWDAVGHPERRILVSREFSYHGMAAFGTSLAGIAPNRQGYGGPIVGDIEHVPANDPDALGVAARGPRRARRGVHRRAGDRRRRRLSAAPTATGPRSTASAGSTACCSSPTR